MYAFGYSNGGHMAMRPASEAPDLVAGIIVAKANVPTADNMGWKLAPTRRAAVVLMEGTRDPINPFDGERVTIFGFGDRGTVLSAPLSDAVQQFGALSVRQQD